VGERAEATLPRLGRPFDDGRLALQLSSGSSPFPFADFAQTLVREREGQITLRVDGLDESYWDIVLDGQVFTLHRQHYLGVFLCSTDVASEAALERLMPFAEGYLRGLEAR